MSEGVEWAIHCCTVLAFLQDEQALPAARLAEFHGLPAPYLAKHLQALVRAGVCESVPGPRGGFRLARGPDEITLLDVTLAVDGDDAAFRCSEIRQRGPAAQDDPSCYRRSCSIARVMWQAEGAWREELRSVTVADIGAGLAVEVNPAQLQESAVWLQAALDRGGSR